MPFDAWRRVNKVLNSSDVNGVLTETPVLIEDLIAQGETLASIRSSVYRALRDRTAFGDYATPWRAEDLFVPRSHIPTRVSLYRQILHARPSSFPLSAGMDAVDGVSLHVSGPEVCLELPDVSADASEILRAAAQLGMTAETWIAYLRVALPDEPIALGETMKVVPSGRMVVVPREEYRRLWTADGKRGGALRLLRARKRMSRNDAERLDAAMTWAGLSMWLWAESPVRALSLVWMALEVLFGDIRHVYDIGTRPYLKHLSRELSYEIARHVGRRVASDAPGWLSSVRADGLPNRRWLYALVKAVRDADDEVLLHHRAQQALIMWEDGVRADAAAQVRRDLAFIYATRNGLAHAGDRTISSTIAHYLMNTAIEILKSTVSEIIGVNESGGDVSKLDDLFESCWPKGAG